MKKIKYILPFVALLVVLIAAKPVNDNATAKFTGEQLFRGIFFFQGDIPNQISAFEPIKDKLTKLKPFEKIKLDEMIDNVVSNVKKLDPNYFLKLQTAVDSKDNYKIEEEMKNGSKLIYLTFASSKEFEAYTQIPVDLIGKVDISKYDLSKPEGLKGAVEEISFKIKATGEKTNSKGYNPQGSCVAVFVVVALAVWDVLAAVNYGAVVNAVALAVVYAAVYAKTILWGEEELTAYSIQKEIIINDIANLHYVGSSGNVVPASASLIQSK